MSAMTNRSVGVLRLMWARQSEIVDRLAAEMRQAEDRRHFTAMSAQTAWELIVEHGPSPERVLELDLAAAEAHLAEEALEAADVLLTVAIAAEYELDELVAAAERAAEAARSVAA